MAPGQTSREGYSGMCTHSSGHLPRQRPRLDTFPGSAHAWTSSQAAPMPGHLPRQRPRLDTFLDSTHAWTPSQAAPTSPLLTSSCGRSQPPA
eukprot:101137-Chlamydomonas_euryale.AAC.1